MKAEAAGWRRRESYFRSLLVHVSRSSSPEGASSQGSRSEDESRSRSQDDSSKKDNGGENSKSSSYEQLPLPVTVEDFDGSVHYVI